MGPTLNNQENRELLVKKLIEIAGGNGRPAFSRLAYRRIFRYSGGIPRLINAVCDKALLCGYVTGTDELGWRQVRRAVRELEGKTS